MVKGDNSVNTFTLYTLIFLIKHRKYLVYVKSEKKIK